MVFDIDINSHTNKPIQLNKKKTHINQTEKALNDYNSIRQKIEGSYNSPTDKTPSQGIKTKKFNIV